MGIMDYISEYVIVVLNEKTRNTKYCPSLGSYASEKYAYQVCNKLNKQYAKQLAKYNCKYECIPIAR